MSSEEEAVAWLRAAIQERKATAQEAADGDSGEWFTGRKWNVYRAEDEARYDDDYQGEENRLVVYGNVKPQSEHIALNDPQDTIARCEAELAILDACASSRSTEAALEAGDISTEEYVTGEVMGSQIVRLLAGGYKHRAGFPALLVAA